MPLIVIVVIGCVSNLLVSRWLRSLEEVPEVVLAVVMAVDIALLTALLYFTGGATNPFSGLYIIQISLAAVILESKWTLFLAAFAFLAFGSLFISHEPMPEISEAQYRVGLWVALGVASTFVGYFLKRVVAALQAREEELSKTRELAEKRERVASLATLAAGAAHELSTPLGTIGLVAKELKNQLGGASSEVVADIELVQQELARCRRILDQMAGNAGESAGEQAVWISVTDLLETSLEGIRLAPEVILDIADELPEVRVPWVALAQAIRAVVTNGQDASESDPVRVMARQNRNYVRIIVVDKGGGMDEESVARCTEPFFTTKEPGSGMGMGLFLTQALVERLGGALSVKSILDVGTTVEIKLPKKTNYVEPIGEPIAS